MSNSIEVINNLGENVNVEVSDKRIVITWKNKERQLSDLKPGEIFNKNGIEYIVCDHINGTTAVIRKELLKEDMKFGETNDWTKSSIRKYLNDEYLREVEKAFGSENVIENTRNLVSLDGLDDYGECKDKISLLNIFDYIKYRKYIGKCNRWWWLLTPNSTPSGYGSDDVLYVRSDADVCCSWCDCSGGVRPFFILKSSIFVSCEERSE